ncbi:MAG: hypothetical protein KGZ84_01970 [Erysipelotrichia bacterium]|jgi:hypothetical protein|nr:hypothetical protein [Erysipelotrichia bacterium]
MLLREIILFIILLTLTILVRIRYFKTKKRSFLGNFLHVFFGKDLYQDYDHIIESSEKS